MQIAWLVSFVRVLPVQSCLSSLVEAAYGSCVDSRICSLSQRIQVFGKRYLLCYVTNKHMPGAYIYPFNCCFHELKRRDLQQHLESEIQLHDWFDQTHARTLRFFSNFTASVAGSAHSSVGAGMPSLQYQRSTHQTGKPSHCACKRFIAKEWGVLPRICHPQYKLSRYCVKHVRLKHGLGAGLGAGSGHVNQI